MILLFNEIILPGYKYRIMFRQPVINVPFQVTILSKENLFFLFVRSFLWGLKNLSRYCRQPETNLLLWIASRHSFPMLISRRVSLRLVWT